MAFLKNLKNNLTGNWADVTVLTRDAHRGGSLAAAIDVIVKDAAVTVDQIWLEISCEEVVSIPTQYLRRDGAQPSLPREVTQRLHSHRVPAAGPMQLAAGSAQRFEAYIPLPAQLPPTYHGRNARVQWSVRGRVDMRGNDPDSGWLALTVT